MTGSVKKECQQKVPPEGPPYASRVLDFLRATVLCDSVEGTIYGVWREENWHSSFYVFLSQYFLNPIITQFSNFYRFFFSIKNRDFFVFI